MSVPEAPLYVVLHDVVLWFEANASCDAGCDLLDDLRRTAREALVDVSVALAFPDQREQACVAVDRGLVRLRVLCRVACDRGSMSRRGRLHVGREIDRAGKMLGGWRRRQSATAKRRTEARLEGNSVG